MNNSLVKRFTVTEDLEAYQGFFDSQWATEQLERVKPLQYKKPLFDLLVAWRGTSYAREMPVMALNSVTSSVDSALRLYPTLGVRLIDALKLRLEQSLVMDPLTPRQKHLLKLDLEGLRAQVQHTLNTNKIALDRKALWKAVVDHADMKLSLAKSEESAYLALYYSYEVFLTNCVGIALGRSDYKWYKARTFEKDLSQATSSRACDFCWRDDIVTKARLVRNALLHNGGRISDELERFRSTLCINDDVLCIRAPDTTILAQALKSRVGAFIDDLHPPPTKHDATTS